MSAKSAWPAQSMLECADRCLRFEVPLQSACYFLSYPYINSPLSFLKKTSTGLIKMIVFCASYDFFKTKDMNRPPLISVSVISFLAAGGDGKARQTQRPFIYFIFGLLSMHYIFSLSLTLESPESHSGKLTHVCLLPLILIRITRQDSVKPDNFSDFITAEQPVAFR